MVGGVLSPCLEAADVISLAQLFGYRPLHFNVTSFIGHAQYYMKMDTEFCSSGYTKASLPQHIDIGVTSPEHCAEYCIPNYLLGQLASRGIPKRFSLFVAHRRFETIDRDKFFAKTNRSS